VREWAIWYHAVDLGFGPNRDDLRTGME
jgi:hypothetical protein